MWRLAASLGSGSGVERILLPVLVRPPISRTSDLNFFFCDRKRWSEVLLVHVGERRERLNSIKKVLFFLVASYILAICHENVTQLQ